MDDHLTSLARQLIVDAESEPAETLRRARALLDGQDVDGKDSGSHELVDGERHLVLRAAGVAARQLGQFDEAEAMLDACLAESGQDRADRGQAFTTRAGLFAMIGEFDRAFADLDHALPFFDGVDRVHPLAQRAVVLHQSGALDEAATGYAKALELAEQGGTTLLEARLRSNLGVLCTHQADYDRANAELGRAAELYRSAGHGNQLLLVEHNLGYVAMCQGRIIDALAHFEDQRRAAIELGGEVFRISADLCHALMIAGLTDEAEAEGIAAAEHFERLGSLVAASDAYTSAGRAALDSGRPHDAVAHLTSALELFDRAERTPWRAVAQVLLAQARLASGAAPERPSDLDAAIEALDEATMRDQASVARLIAVQHAVRSGDRDLAQQRLAAVGRVAQLPTQLRPMYWLAVGEYRLLDGRAGSAARAFGAGARANENFRQDLAGIDIVLSVGAVGIDLAAAGLAAALASARHDPLRVMRWIEAFEPAGLSTLGAANHTEAARASPPRSRRASTTRRAPATRSELQADLDGSDLVMIGDAGDRYMAVTCVDGVTSQTELGATDAVHEAVARLRAQLRRAWASPGDVDSYQPGLHAAAAAVEQLLVPRLSPSERPLVVTLPSTLRFVPLGLLPSLRARSFVVAPSFRVHINARRAAEDGVLVERRAVFVAGPDLPEASREVHAAARFHQSALVLEEERASIDRVLASLPGSLLHVACHGVVRDDSPIFSSLQLTDGDLRLHRFADLASVARCVILSGCDVGRPARRGRSHMVSMPRVLLDLGVASVIASSIAVPDDATADMMIELHELLGDGMAPADALAQVRSSEAPASALVAAVFSCHGASVAQLGLGD